jgi:hypothetical protein
MPNIEISDLPLATLPLDSANSFFEVQTIEGGVPVSRRIAETDIMADLPDGTTVGSIIRLSVVPDVYVNSEQILADGVSVILQHVTTPVVRTLTTAAGGLEVDNQLTGGGFERVLTETDGALGALSDVTLTAPATGSVLYKSAGDWLDTNAVDIDPAAAVQLRNNGVVRLATTSNGITVTASGSLGLITLFASASVAAFLSMYNPTNGGVALKNQNPDARLVQISTGGGEEDVWIDMVRDGLVGLRHNDVQMARTVVIGSGGFEVNNTLTGAGFERVLTVSDITGSIALDDLTDVVIASADSFDTLFFNGSNWVDSAMLQITGTGATMGGVTLGITGINVRGRFANAGESGGSTQTTVAWLDDDGSQAFGEIEFRTTGGGSDGDAFYFRNRRHGGNIEFEGEDVSGNLRRAFTFNPDVDTSVFHAPSNAIVWRTVTPANGSMEIDNQSTGAGFERVLTTADLAGALGLGDLSDVTLTAPATGAVLFKSAGNWLDTEAILVNPGTSVTLDDDLIILGGATRLIELFPTGGERFQISLAETGTTEFVMGFVGQPSVLRSTEVGSIILGNITGGTGAVLIGGGNTDRIAFHTATTRSMDFTLESSINWDITNNENGGEIAVRATQGGGSVVDMVHCDPDGAVSISNAAVIEVRTQQADAAGFTTGARIRDHGDVFRDIGFNTLPIIEVPASRTLSEVDVGKLLHRDGGLAGTITLPSGTSGAIPLVGAWIQFACETATAVTISAAGTLRFFDGSGTPGTGNRTISEGGIANLFHYSDTEWWIWGFGIT